MKLANMYTNKLWHSESTIKFKFCKVEIINFPIFWEDTELKFKCKNGLQNVTIYML